MFINSSLATSNPAYHLVYMCLGHFYLRKLKRRRWLDRSNYIRPVKLDQGQIMLDQERLELQGLIELPLVRNMPPCTSPAARAIVAILLLSFIPSSDIFAPRKRQQCSAINNAKKRQLLSCRINIIIIIGSYSFSPLIHIGHALSA